MFNGIKNIVIVIAVTIFICSAAYAQDKSSASEKKAAIIDVGNKICPVSGDKVSGKDFYEYKGKRYGFCCSMCPATFASNPEKYAAIAEKEAKK